MGRTVKVGTRKSMLAMAQTKLVIEALQKAASGYEYELIPISTVGDEILNQPLLAFGGKGVFVDVFERALLEGRIDLAVHSAKDMTMSLPEGLSILGIPKREDPRDVLVTRREKTKKERLLVGTGSLRRQTQLVSLMDADCKGLRGNVTTRLQKLREGEYDGIVLAAAGLKRLDLLGLEEFEYRFFETEEMIPAAGQGILAVEGRTGDELANIFSVINHKDSVLCLHTERRVLEILEAGCHEPVGVFSCIKEDILELSGMYAQGTLQKRVHLKGTREQAADLAVQLAEQLKNT